MVSIIFGMNIDNSSEEATAGHGGAAAQEQCVIEGQEAWGFALALHLFLPIAGMALLWTQKDIFSRVLLQLDRSCVSVFCPSFSKREKLLKWASARLPLTWSSQARTLSSGIPELWKDGSLLCTLINSVVPGACPNPHRHWKKPPLHAQALACKYLGLPPRFTDSDLSGDFTIHLERNFICYLNDLQRVINKWPGTKDDEETKRFSSQYVARGMGLYTGEVNRKASFYIYSNASTKKRDNLLMYIRGPYGTRGKGNIPNLKAVPVINLLQDHFKPKKTHFDSRKSFLRTISLDFHTLIGNVEKKTDEKEIAVKVDLETDRAKITYIPEHSGIYEITIISDGELIKGSPFVVRVTKNESGCREKFEAESPRVQDEKVVLTKRRVISKVIDCIDEKIRIDEDKAAREHLEITAVKKRDDEIFKAEVKLEKIDELDFKNNNLNNNQKPKEMVETTAAFLKNIINATQEPQPKKNYLGISSTVSSSSGPQSLESQSSLSSSTSSICPAHIVPEVNFQRLPVEAKRKLFALHDSKNDCSFSESENEDTSRESRFRELSVLNILDSLKQSQGPSCYPLSATASLPNIPRNLVVPCENHESVFKAKKEYWERLSSASSSKSSIVSCKKFAVSDKNLFNNIKDNKEYSKYENGDVTKTVTNKLDDVISVKYDDNPLKEQYKSAADDELEHCTVLSVKERKKILLKSNYEKVKIVPKKLNIKALSFGDFVKNNNKENSRIFSPISERIQKFDTPLKSNVKRRPPLPLSIQTEEKIPELNPETEAVEQLKKPSSPTRSGIKSQFKKAIEYFKNLEDASKALIKNRAGKVVLKRRYSLESPSKSATAAKVKSKGGSLNLSNISERFSISNLYEDVVGNVGRRSSFKGTPNKLALVHSLASLDTNKSGAKNVDVGTNNRDENIRYNLFVHNSKAKVRKSIKNLFDVNY